ncbi:aliphatic sulfonate ABC transporter substrate-binding protein [Acinetobacter shaoyimingii]|uniref:Putative aliphatic sulfonates-binding protein n=1 Tax=Acinetobacter shaoyimingii TaxID=2715164 RepID=A0A6G8RZV2_9GAMM|nr:aliphatic sulfonate ABC transporter substrate-binding protein [Acinetobacter shaoyimingii]NHB59125.1 aliphatic sulfonate ABC transporter substrate-binding protein [Acinetobacter shaoyimingii]QIO07328.1 aliphatic sulfonate ABC transporter substrate-binding protein [Acinetobacter shaoyimingii]
MGLFKSFSLVGITAVSLGLVACEKNQPTEQNKTNTATASEQKKDDVKTVSIGFQKSSLNLLVAREQKLLESQFPGAKIEWREFPAGPQMLEALAVGAVDFGAVGNTPPIFAQSADKNLNYAAYEVYPGSSLGLVLPEKSNITDLSGLKGKRIALQKGSSAHEFLAKVLQKAGLTWQDIQPIWLPPADARAALDKGSVDAWAIWDPFLSAVELNGHVKVLIDSQVFPKTYSYYISNPSFTTVHPDAVNKVIKSLNEADQWILKNQTAAVELYGKSTGLVPEVAKRALDRRLKPSPILAINSEVIQSQQKIADLFYTEKLIPKKINVQDAVLSADNK